MPSDTGAPSVAPAPAPVVHELSARPLVVLYAGDCLDSLRAMIAARVQVDSVITDPPYHLESIVARFGAAGAARANDPEFDRVSRRWVGKNWDGGDIAFRADFWGLVAQVVKPGGYVAAFAADRYYHRMGTAMEDAGLEPRRMFAWLYATGRMKAKNLAKMVEKRFGAAAAKEFEGWATDVKPALEPVALFRRPLAGTHAMNARAHKTGAINIVAGAVPVATSDADGQQSIVEAVDGGAEAVDTMAGARFPSNVFHDASAEVESAFAAFGVSGSSSPPKNGGRFVDDFGSPSRFFFGARAGAGDRLESEHPSVKPVAALRWLCRMLIPRGGVVLDPFAGTGTTGAAAVAEGFGVVMMERESEYVADICRRFRHISGADLPLFG
jgi:site-specific DNA-methyltransferase (adenine-specific)